MNDFEVSKEDKLRNYDAMSVGIFSDNFVSLAEGVDEVNWLSNRS